MTESRNEHEVLTPRATAIYAIVRVTQLRGEFVECFPDRVGLRLLRLIARPKLLLLLLGDCFLVFLLLPEAIPEAC